MKNTILSGYLKNPISSNKKDEAISGAKNLTKLRTTKILTKSKFERLDKTVSEIVEIKKILDNEKLTEDEKLSSLDHYFNVILYKSDPKVINKFLEIKKNIEDLNTDPRYRNIFKGENEKGLE